MEDIRFIKLIIENNNGMHLNRCKFDGEQLFEDNDMNFSRNVDTLMDNMPCVDEDGNISIMFDLSNKCISNWNKDYDFECNFDLGNKGIYQFINSNRELVREEEFIEIPDQLPHKNGVLTLDVNSEGKILNII